MIFNCLMPSHFIIWSTNIFLDIWYYLGSVTNFLKIYCWNICIFFRINKCFQVNQTIKTIKFFFNITQSYQFKLYEEQVYQLCHILQEEMCDYALSNMNKSPKPKNLKNLQYVVMSLFTRQMIT